MQTTKRLLFFATKDDMISGFNEIFSNIIIVKAGNQTSDIPIIYEEIGLLPDLGFRTYWSHCMENYLLMNIESKANLRKVVQKNGAVFYCLYQSDNLDTIVFSPSYLNVNENSLVHGQFAVSSLTDFTTSRMSLIRRTLKQHFFFFRGWYIGKEAESLFYDKGTRLITSSIGESTEYDLNLVDRHFD